MRTEWLDEESKLRITEARKMVVSHQQIRPVGERIMKQEVIGFKHQNRKQLEADLKAGLPDGSFLEIDCNVKDGSITWFTNEKNHEMVRMTIQAKVDQAREAL